jgi:hypothetical protein
MMVDYYIGCIMHITLAQNYGRTFMGLCMSVVYFSSGAFKKYKIISWKKKEFEELKYFLILLDFIL